MEAVQEADLTASPSVTILEATVSNELMKEEKDNIPLGMVVKRVDLTKESASASLET
jgi:hypothetical protein